MVVVAMWADARREKDDSDKKRMFTFSTTFTRDMERKILFCVLLSTIGAQK